MRKKNDDKQLDLEISKIKNPILQSILIALSHPKIWISLLIVAFVVISLITVRISFKDGKWSFGKSTIKLDKATETIGKVKELIK